MHYTDMHREIFVKVLNRTSSDFALLLANASIEVQIQPTYSPEDCVALQRAFTAECAFRAATTPLATLCAHLRHFTDPPVYGPEVSFADL